MFLDGSRMSSWQIHWLEAEGDLRPWCKDITSEIEAAHDAISQLIVPPRLDIIIQRFDGALVIPEIGMVGRAYRKSLFSLTLDPTNEHFNTGVTDGTLRRHVAHEVHHCLRMGGSGYGHTLGEALVSEGLAGRFVARLFGNAPEPWERAIDAATLKTHYPDLATLNSTNFDHGSWFIGKGEQPRWLGYTLGYEIVGRWLEFVGEVDGHTWANVAADTVLAATWKEIGQV